MVVYCQSWRPASPLARPGGSDRAFFKNNNARHLVVGEAVTIIFRLNPARDMGLNICASREGDKECGGHIVCGMFDRRCSGFGGSRNLPVV